MKSIRLLDIEKWNSNDSLKDLSFQLPVSLSPFHWGTPVLLGYNRSWKIFSPIAFILNGTTIVYGCTNGTTNGTTKSQLKQNGEPLLNVMQLSYLPHTNTEYTESAVNHVVVSWILVLRDIWS